MAEKPGLMLYYKEIDAIRQMDNPVDQLSAYDCMIEYSRTGVDPNPANPPLRYLWPLLRDAVKRDHERFERVSIASRMRGLKSAFVQYAKAKGIDPNDEEAFATYVAERDVEKLRNAQHSTAVKQFESIQQYSNGLKAIKPFECFQMNQPNTDTDTDTDTDANVESIKGIPAGNPDAPQRAFEDYVSAFADRHRL